jgi:hypothetical protein
MVVAQKNNAIPTGFWEIFGICYCYHNVIPTGFLLVVFICYCYHNAIYTEFLYLNNCILHIF